MIGIFKGQSMEKNDIEDQYNSLLRVEIEKLEKKEA